MAETPRRAPVGRADADGTGVVAARRQLEVVAIALEDLPVAANCQVGDPAPAP